MSSHRSIVSSRCSGLVLFFLFAFTASSYAQDGKAIFQQKCAACHAIDKNLTGPALKGVEERWPAKADLYGWIRNSAALIKAGHPRAVAVYAEYNKIQMPAFPELKDADIDAILGYINTAAAAKAAPAAAPGGATQTSATEKNDSALIFGILTLILAVIMLILLQVNSNLKKLSDEREGQPVEEAIPFYRNKAYIALASIILFMVGGFYVFQGARGLGRSQNYQPVQPIYYSHTVHAGVNQIS
jgi:mono/diheme cytochrome c family protein